MSNNNNMEGEVGIFIVDYEEVAYELNFLWKFTEISKFETFFSKFYGNRNFIDFEATDQQVL